MEVAVGDWLQWTRNDHALGRRNGQEFQGADLDDGQVLIRWGRGESRWLDDADLAHLKLCAGQYDLCGSGKDGGASDWGSRPSHGAGELLCGSEPREAGFTVICVGRFSTADRAGGAVKEEREPWRSYISWCGEILYR